MSSSGDYRIITNRNRSNTGFMMTIFVSAITTTFFTYIQMHEFDFIKRLACFIRAPQEYQPLLICQYLYYSQYKITRTDGISCPQNGNFFSVLFVCFALVGKNLTKLWYVFDCILEKKKLLRN